jgi:protein LTV1
MDPDVVAAMDEDFDFEDPDNELEDNFVELANAEGSGCDMGSGGNSYGNNDYE